MPRHGRAQPFHNALYPQGSALSTREALIRLQGGRPTPSTPTRHAARFVGRVLLLTLGFLLLKALG